MQSLKRVVSQEFQIIKVRRKTARRAPGDFYGLQVERKWGDTVDSLRSFQEIIKKIVKKSEVSDKTHLLIYFKNICISREEIMNHIKFKHPVTRE